MASRVMSGGDKLEAYLSKMATNLTNASSVKVGFLEGATYPDGTPVALIASIQNFGAPSQGIPPRPFFSNMIDKHGGEWGDDTAELLMRTNGDAAETLGLMGEHLSGQVRDEIIATNEPPLKPATIARKKGRTKPLIDTSVMLNSVDYEVE